MMDINEEDDDDDCSSNNKCGSDWCLRKEKVQTNKVDYTFGELYNVHLKNK